MDLSLHTRAEAYHSSVETREIPILSTVPSSLGSSASHDGPYDDDENNDRDNFDSTDEEFNFAKNSYGCKMDHQVDDQEDRDPQRGQCLAFVPEVDEELRESTSQSTSDARISEESDTSGLQLTTNADASAPKTATHASQYCQPMANPRAGS